jgi:hypothetical protein
MKIFPNQSVTESKPVKSKGAAKTGQVAGRKKSDTPAKKEISESEIREKLASRVETSEAAKMLAIKKTSQKLGEGFLSDEIKLPPRMSPLPEVAAAGDELGEEKSPNTKDFIMKSDVAKNDPKDTNTQEKLKSIISKGAFNFNPKEREALERILAGN